MSRGLDGIHVQHGAMPPADIGRLLNRQNLPFFFQQSSGFLNQFMAGNTFHLTAMSQSIKQGDTVDFYVQGPTANGGGHDDDDKPR